MTIATGKIDKTSPKQILFCSFQLLGLIIVALYQIIFWPVNKFFKRFINEGRYLTSHGTEKIKAQKKHEVDTILSSRAHMIEVSSESSFQPLLQLYLILPTIIHMVFSVKLRLDMPIDSFFGSVFQIQLWSVVTSALSLAWSFSFYQAVKKQGALDFGTNSIGRILLTISNVFQISSRMILLVLLAYCFGPGEFWPMFVLLLLHIVVMASSYFFSFRQQMSGDSCVSSVYQCILNGISNIYLHTLILPLDYETNNTRKNHRTWGRQMFVDAVFTIENFIVASAACFLIEDFPTPLPIGAFFGHAFGVFLKWLYYCKFHVWSKSSWTKSDEN